MTTISDRDQNPTGHQSEQQENDSLLSPSKEFERSLKQIKRDNLSPLSKLWEESEKETGQND